ncbi:MAG: hypothetical protein CL843_08295 [Crocinitomicaceae bacterium]|nr:hypothetical protein [Crocinitomicaceae bacterium]
MIYKKCRIIFYPFNKTKEMQFIALFIPILVLLLYVGLQLLKIQNYVLLIKKDMEVIEHDNKLEKEYQFIKGLF